jgi:hypothetical protein
MKKQIMDAISINGEICTRRMCESYFEKNHIDMYNYINNLHGRYDLPFKAKIYLIINDIEEPPKCKICGNAVKFKRISKGFAKYCSLKCIGLDDEIKKKREKTSIEHYGCKSPFQSKELREKYRKVCLEKYGVEFPQQLEEFKQKAKETSIAKYGVEHHLKLKSQQEKSSETCLKNNGCKNPMQSKEIKEKAKKTNIEKYGYENPNQSDEIKEKIKQTNLERYGNECYMCSDVGKNNIKNIVIEKYGVTSYSKTDECKKKVKKTNLDRYGNENYNNIEQIKKTNLEKYGFENAAQNKEVINKIKVSWDKSFSEKYSKTLGITPKDIEICGDSVNIFNYCDKHTPFNISKSLLYTRAITYEFENICTECNPISENASLVEIELRNFVASLGVTYRANYIFTKSRQEIDVYLPNYKLGIEFDGLYWHSELFRDREYHKNKTNECEKLGIQLLHVFEDEWYYKRNIVKSIIKSKLNLFDCTINASDCEVKNIDNEECSRFLDLNHIYGNINTTIKLGLYCGDDLVSVMTFEKARIGFDEKIFNLNRFTNKLNTQVIGAENKLLEYFIVEYSPKKIIAYADKRYSKGEPYEKMGFNFVHVNPPSYSYFNRNQKKRYHRFKYRKENIIKYGWFDANKTINEILLSNNIIKIYDCGTIKYEINF